MNYNNFFKIKAYKKSYIPPRVTVFHLSPFTSPRYLPFLNTMNMFYVLSKPNSARPGTPSIYAPQPNNKSTKRCPAIEPGHTIRPPLIYRRKSLPWDMHLLFWLFIAICCLWSINGINDMRSPRAGRLETQTRAPANAGTTYIWPK